MAELLDETEASPDAVEVVRAFVIDGGLQVHLQRAFEDPEAWGILLVDIARHAARVYAAEGACSEDTALMAIKSMFDAEWDSPTDPGTTHAQQ